jgi:hypothetical protein
VDAGVRLGLGKQEEDDKYTSAENVTRKKLESEIQAEEDPERTKRREVGAAGGCLLSRHPRPAVACVASWLC